MVLWKKILVSIVVVCVIFIAGWAALLHLPERTETFVSDTRPSGLFSTLSDFFQSVFQKKSLAVVVFGVPGEGHNGPELTDSIIFIYFNPDRNQAHVVSIPRDLWVSDGATHFKINESLTRHETSTALSVIESITGIASQGYVVVNLAMVKEAIDVLGGVDIVLEKPAVDWVSGYTLDAGLHHLNGDDALWLIRNRYASEGDFFREHNQQNIIKQAFAKFKELSKEEKINFVNTFVVEKDLLEQTDIDVSSLVPYVSYGDFDSITIKSIELDFSTHLVQTINIPLAPSSSLLATSSTSSINVSTSSTATPSFISAIAPVAGIDNYDALREYVQERLKE